MRRIWLVLLSTLAIFVVAAFVVTTTMSSAAKPSWSPEEKAVLQDLWLESLPPLPSDPSNQYAADPRAAELGKALFFDPRFSSNGVVSCSSCHNPELHFTDGLPLARGVGRTNRKAMTVVGTAYSPWLFWDGRKDSQWAQVTEPLENSAEHNLSRSQIAHLLMTYYREPYEAIFGLLPDLSDVTRFPEQAGPVAEPKAKVAWQMMTSEDQHTINQILVNLGKAIAAYERTLQPKLSRFDHHALTTMYKVCLRMT
jgi:cytochrome c peroxidase